MKIGEISFFIFFGLACLVSATNDLKKITVLSTTDIHGSIYTSKPDAASWLKLATVIQEERRRAGKDNSLLIDCGDTVQGSYIGLFSRGHAELKIMKYLKYDAWVLGNHELDWGIKHLKSLCLKADVPILNGNFRINGLAPFPAYRMLKRNGVSIAIIGMNTAGLNKWFFGSFYSGYKVKSSLLILKSLLPKVQRLKPDIIILAQHQGLMETKTIANEVKSIAYTFPQIDLILGGHTHRPFPGKKIVDSWYVQAEAHAVSLAKINLFYNPEKGVLEKIESTLIPVHSRKEDKALKKIIEPYIQKMNDSAGRVLSRVPFTIDASGHPGFDCRISYAIQEAASQRTEVDAVLLARVNAASIYKGKITEKDVFRIMPYENYLLSAAFTKAELRAVINEQFKFYKHRAFNGIFGIDVSIDRKSLTVRQIDFPKNRKTIRLLISSYTAASGGGRFPILHQLISQKAFKEHQLNTRDVLMDYLAITPDWYKRCRAYYKFVD